MVNDKRESPVSRAISESAANASPTSILVIEDDDDSRDMLVELIRSLGHQSTGVASASELFGAMPAPWSVALIDLDLPEVNGCEIARRLRENPSNRDKRLIALTGHSDEASRKAATQAGFDEFLVKPILPEQLARMLEPKIA